ncbi:vacuolar protein sorting-associated protein 37B [Armigeres subalbatus]|uniref:vacuolar protein sorting-associated protein 37B n=1 Tax=Armigeres subalbatus TaxID=124917 RepID=UPI002ED3AEE9
MYQQYLNQAVRTLQNLSSDELKDLLNDDDKLDQRVDLAVEALESEKEVILSENRSLAESNLEKEPKLIELRSKLADLSEQGKTLATSVKEKSDELKSKSSSTNPDTVLALLQAAAAESEEESERIAKQFLDNELAIDAYLEQFMTPRKAMHSRKLKADKMVELLRNGINQQRPSALPPMHGSPASGAIPYPSHAGGFYPPPPQPSAGTIPYPLGPISMPMPGMFRPPY